MQSGAHIRVGWGEWGAVASWSPLAKADQITISEYHYFPTTLDLILASLSYQLFSFAFAESLAIRYITPPTVVSLEYCIARGRSLFPHNLQP